MESRDKNEFHFPSSRYNPETEQGRSVRGSAQDCGSLRQKAMGENGSEIKNPVRLEQMLRKMRRKQKGQMEEEGEEGSEGQPQQFQSLTMEPHPHPRLVR